MKTQNILLLAAAAVAIWYFTKKKGETPSEQSTTDTSDTTDTTPKNKPTTGENYTVRDTALPNVVLSPGLPGSSYGSGSKKEAEMVGIGVY